MLLTSVGVHTGFWSSLEFGRCGTEFDPFSPGRTAAYRSFGSLPTLLLLQSATEYSCTIGELPYTIPSHPAASSACDSKKRHKDMNLEPMSHHSGSTPKSPFSGVSDNQREKPGLSC
ncbi:unnamed protein product [Lepidochelys kempii]